MPNDKVKISQKEIDEVYEIESDKTIEEETTKAQESEPEFLTQEEQEHDKKLMDTYNIDEEKE